MAFDGVTIAGIVSELKDKLIGNRIYKIAQPEKDELILTVKGSCLMWSGSYADVGRCIAAVAVSDTKKQDKSYDSAEFLYAAAQASAKCAHCVGDTAGTGENRPL